MEEPKPETEGQRRRRVYRTIVATLSNGMLTPGWTKEEQSPWTTPTPEPPRTSSS